MIQPAGPIAANNPRNAKPSFIAEEAVKAIAADVPAIARPVATTLGLTLLNTPTNFVP